MVEEVKSEEVKPEKKVEGKSSNYFWLFLIFIVVVSVFACSVLLAKNVISLHELLWGVFFTAVITGLILAVLAIMKSFRSRREFVKREGSRPLTEEEAQNAVLQKLTLPLTKGGFFIADSELSDPSRILLKGVFVIGKHAVEVFRLVLRLRNSETVYDAVVRLDNRKTLVQKFASFLDWKNSEGVVNERISMFAGYSVPTMVEKSSYVDMFGVEHVKERRIPYAIQGVKEEKGEGELE